MVRRESGLFPALIKHWRSRRGLSQLDLALAADVSPRHVSFLETGRAHPSREMILRLATALGVPLRDQNALLTAANFPPAFEEPGLAEGLPPALRLALDRMMAQQEPYPLAVMNRRYDILETNRAGALLLGRFVAEPAAAAPPMNVFRALFDRRLARPFVADWERVARLMLARLHREVLERPGDGELAALLRGLFEYPGVPEGWQEPDLSLPSEPCLCIRLERDDLALAFVTTVTVFSAPQNVTLDELRIESYFPLDDTTRRACERLARS
jgi:transcriptional regulator with XRE-family HTH domain